MKVTLIGHASIFIETTNCRILMDPVFWDPFCEGLNASCPKRKVKPEYLPTYDFLVISHQHLDHFDIRTLAYLSKNVDVLIPPDPLIIETLKKLGYKCIYPLQDFDQIKCGDTTIMTTRSEIQVPEFGLVVADSSGVFWNTVDTYFAPPTIQRVKERFPNIDFLLATWHISREVLYQTGQSLEFPFHLYGELFNLLRLVESKALAPGASGWKYIGHADWQNQVVFPVTRERFCYDVKQAFPEMSDYVFALNPGDTVSLNEGNYHYIPANCHYAEMVLDDRHCLDYAPVKAGNPLLDVNPEAIDLNVLHHDIEKAIETKLTEFIRTYHQRMFLIHRRWQIIYQLEVSFPDTHRHWFIDFSRDPLQIVEARNPLAGLFAYITASSFYSILQNRRGLDFLWCSGDYRSFQKVYLMTNEGIISPNAGEINEPLLIYFSHSLTSGANLTADIAKYQQLPQSENHSKPCTDTSPLLMGSDYIKRSK